MRMPFVAANWKMFKTLQEAFAYTKEFAPLVQDVNDVEIVLAPPFTALHTVAETARNATNIGVAGQNMSFEREGAFTGEVSAAMLKDAGADYVIIGHSERRTLFGETDATVARKIAAAFGADLVPIACIGETLAEREAGQTFAVLDRQIRDGLGGVSREHLRQLVIAYEPVWAIGTGRTATAEQAQEAHAHIRKRLREQFGDEAATECRVIYGGSVKPANTRELVGQPDVDGALVGGASLDVNAFAEIVAKSRPVA